MTQYGYDTQGNRNALTNGGATTSYGFDAENWGYVSPGRGYAYDAAGRRVAKTTSTGTPTEYYFYDQAGQLMYSFDPNALLATNYIYPGTKLDSQACALYLHRVRLRLAPIPMAATSLCRGCGD